MSQESYNKFLYNELIDMTVRLEQRRASLPRAQMQELEAFASELDSFRVEVCTLICIDQAGIR